jgi:hypothetical protein
MGHVSGIVITNADVNFAAKVKLNTSGIGDVHAPRLQWISQIMLMNASFTEENQDIVRIAART